MTNEPSIDKTAERLLTEAGISVEDFKGPAKEPQRKMRMAVLLGYHNNEPAAYCFVIGQINKSEIKLDGVTQHVIIYEKPDFKEFVEEYDRILSCAGIKTHVNPLEMSIMNENLAGIKMVRKQGDENGKELLDAVKVASFVLRGDLPERMLIHYT